MQESSPPTSRLQHFPITLLPTAMGLAGLAIVLFKSHQVFGGPALGPGLLIGVSAWFTVLLGIYAVKTVRYPSAALAEFRHPIRINFFPGISISLLLLAIGYAEWDRLELARVLFWIGAPLHLLLLLVILYGWFHKAQKLPSFNPAWFIPVVGPILVPVAGLEFAHPELLWFFFAVGIVWWIVMLAVLVNRIFFHDPLPQKLLPTLFILMAPPAVGFIATVKLTGELDAFARVLFYFGLFTGLMLLTMVDQFRKVPYFVSWWGYTFPLDALTLSLYLMAARTQLPAFRAAAGVMTVVTALTILWVLVKTVQQAVQGKICVAED